MIKELMQGLSITFKHLFRKPVTVSYPEQRLPVSARVRWLHHLNRHENGLERCIGCALCAANCPANAILVEAADNTDENRYSPGERYAKVYQINMIRCIFCGYCEEACPADAIVLGEKYELAEYTREDMIYDKQRLLVPPGETGTIRFPIAKE